MDDAFIQVKAAFSLLKLSSWERNKIKKERKRQVKIDWYVYRVRRIWGTSRKMIHYVLGGALLDIVDAVTRTNGPPPWGRGGFQDGDNLSTFFFHGFHIHQEWLQGRVEHVCLQQSRQQAVHCQMDYIHRVLRWKCVGQLIDSITFYSIKCFRQNQPAHVQFSHCFLNESRVRQISACRCYVTPSLSEMKVRLELDASKGQTTGSMRINTSSIEREINSKRIDNQRWFNFSWHFLNLYRQSLGWMFNGHSELWLVIYPWIQPTYCWFTHWPDSFLQKRIHSLIRSSGWVGVPSSRPCLYNLYKLLSFPCWIIHI